MNIEELMNKRHNVLEKIGGEMQEHLIAAQLAAPEEQDAPEGLNVVLDGIGFGGEEAIGEFCFLPVSSEEAEVQYFTAVITIADELDTERIGELFEAMSYINFKVPAGSYSIDKDRSFLVYKLTTPLSIGLSEDALYEQVNISMGTATAMADLYMDLLLRILENEITLQDVITALN